MSRTRPTPGSTKDGRPFQINALGQPVGLPVEGWTSALPPSSSPLDGRYCRLERLNVEKHGSSLWQAACGDRDGSTWTYLPYGPHATIEAYLAHLSDQQDSHDPHFYAVIDLDRTREGAAGVCSLMRFSPEMGSIEIGHIYFSPSLQRTRAATEAIFLLLSEAFERLGYRRVEWKCNALNDASKRAAERLGFHHEGLFRQTAVVKGRNRDTAWYSIVDNEWPALAEGFRRWLDPENFDEEGRQRRSLGAMRDSRAVL